MLKYTSCEVVFAEIPNEISLAINISNCPCKCSGCHSPYLAKDIGTLLTPEKLREIIEENRGITCVCFMGGDSEPRCINSLAKLIKETTDLKVGWYSGRQVLSADINLEWFDFIKVGPYVEQFGPLNNPNTNQIMYKVVHENGNDLMFNITNKFWKEP